MEKRGKIESKWEKQNERESGAMTEKAESEGICSERNVGEGLTQFQKKICES